MAKSKATFKDSQSEFKSLSNSILAGKFERVYLLMGEQSFFIDRLSDLLEAHVIPESDRVFSQIVVYGKDANGGALVNMCRQMPMMGSKQLVIVKEAQGVKDFDQLIHYVKSAQDSTVLVICYKNGVLDKRTAIYKALTTNGVVFESVDPRDYEIVPWLDGYISSRGLKIDAVTLQLLADHLGTDLAKIAGEIDKLITSMPVGEKVITAQAVEDNIGISRQFNIFELNKSLSERNIKDALAIVNYFGENPKNNPFVVTISMLFTHFQRIFMLNYKLWECKTRKMPVPDEYALSKLLKLPSPFFLKEYFTAGHNYPLPKLFVILGYIREYDMKSKGVNGGSADDGELLNELILKILYA